MNINIINKYLKYKMKYLKEKYYKFNIKNILLT